MSRFDNLRYNEPNLPAATCPDIDRTIKVINDCRDALDGLTGRWDAMEELREANSGLRKYGEFWKDAAEELSNELDTANERIAELEAQLEEAREKEAA